MKRIRLQSGLIAERLSKEEQQILWNLLNKPTYDKSTPFFTPHDNLKYFIINRKEEGNLCIDTIKANGKTFEVKANVCKLDEKTLKAVRKAYNK